MANDLNFERIVGDHQAMVFRTLLRLTGRRDSVEDLAQEVFLRLYRALPAFRGEASIGTYLYRIVVNVAQDEWKRRQKDRRLLSMSASSSADEDGPTWEEQLAHPGLDSEQQISQREFQELVERELQQLSPSERTVLVLYHQEERSYEQIAHTLELPLNTVRTHLHRGRKRLREGIERSRAERPGAAERPGTAERSAAWQTSR